MFGWSYPEAQIGSWISYDTEIQKNPEDAGCECMQDTDQEQPTVQLEMSNDHIPILERMWKDIIANEFSHRYTWESQISKVVSKLVRHANHRDRETDGTIHWKFMLLKLLITFRKDMEAMNSLTGIGSIIFGKEATNQIPVLSEFLQ